VYKLYFAGVQPNFTSSTYMLKLQTH